MIVVLVIYEIIYQIDINHNSNNSNNINNEIKEKKEDNIETMKTVTRNLNYSHPMYGTADEVFFENKQLGSQMVNYTVHRYNLAVPKPWDVIDIVPDYVYNYKYYIKLDRNIDLNQWKKLYPMIEMNEGILSIESNNEETAIALLNLLLNSELKNITFQEILNKDLLNVSINKLMEHKMVKPKLVDQIMENLNQLNQLKNNNLEGFNNENENEIFTYQTNQYYFLDEFDN